MTEQSEKDLAMSRLKDLALEWRAAKAEQERLEELASAQKALRLEAGRKMLEVMDAVGLQNAKWPEVGTAFVKTVVSPKVDPTRKDELIAWLKSDPNGSALVKEGYDSRSFASFVKERLESGGALPPSDLVDPTAFTDRVVQVNKA